MSHDAYPSLNMAMTLSFWPLSVSPVSFCIQKQKINKILRNIYDQLDGSALYPDRLLIQGVNLKTSGSLFQESTWQRGHWFYQSFE